MGKVFFSQFRPGRHSVGSWLETANIFTLTHHLSLGQDGHGFRQPAQLDAIVQLRVEQHSGGKT